VVLYLAGETGNLVKNANVFVDVDLTLVDAGGRLLNGAREALQQLRDEGCHLFLWSSVGAEYARRVAEQYELTEFFEGFTAKPDIVIDDMPSTAHAPFVYSISSETSWQDLAAEIIERHID
jgi:ribonucleotide monophosphatase NagD (HAD superfamily)